MRPRAREPDDLQGVPRSAPERIRTSDLRFRRPTLYPAELRAQRCTSVAADHGPARAAERAGFEPAMELSAPYSLSRRVPSATRPPLPDRAQCKASPGLPMTPGCRFGRRDLLR